jgi:anthranilate phosphoribosyltransferase
VDLEAAARAAVERGRAALSGEPGPMRDSLAYSAALCLWHLGRAPSVAQAIAGVRAVLDGGVALRHFS